MLRFSIDGYSLESLFTFEQRLHVRGKRIVSGYPGTPERSLGQRTPLDVLQHSLALALAGC